MNKRQRANDIAQAIKETYQPDAVTVCWNLNQARPYNLLSWIPDTVAFACTYHMQNGADVTAVVPLAKRVLFNPDHDFKDSLLQTVGAFIMNHMRLEQQATKVGLQEKFAEALEALTNGRNNKV